MTTHAAPTHDALTQPPSNLVAGQWRRLEPASEGDGSIVSTSPALLGRTLWSATEELSHVEDAISAARAALPEWAGWGAERREGALRAFQELCKAHVEQIAGLISDETGKAMWESKQEAGLLAAKVEITLEAGEFSGRHRVTAFDVPLNETKSGRCHYRPHGVAAVLGPFNFPAHLPNGHIVPALLTGNTIVFKPSDKTPAVGQRLVELYHEALESVGAPVGVVNLVQGGAGPASALASHAGVDAVMFTGSWAVGRRIAEANLDRPGKILALEMGGNSPAVVMPDADLNQALTEIVRGAFNTTGQRCTCTRRVILHEDIAERFIPALVRASQALTIGDPRAEPPVFMGPIISNEMRDETLEFQDRLERTGGEVLLRGRAVEDPIGGDPAGAYVSPSIVRVPGFGIDTDDCGCDEEVFGPLLRVSVVSGFDEALSQANATRYGLAASIFTRDKALIERFLTECRAGCVNINCATAGASSKLPFGGLGFSGNHRPAGAFALDYTAYPVASMFETGDAAAVAPGMTIDPGWLG